MAISRDGGNRTDGMLYLDTAADVTDLAQYAEDNKLTAGQIAHVIATGDDYMLNSLGEWVQQ